MNKLTLTELNNIYPLGENRIGKPIFIDFYADWWGPCKVFEQVLNKVVPEYEDKIQMYKVNIDEEPKLAQNFQVKGIPFVVMIRKDGTRETAVRMDESQLRYYFEGLISNW